MATSMTTSLRFLSLLATCVLYVGGALSAGILNQPSQAAAPTTAHHLTQKRSAPLQAVLPSSLIGTAEDDEVGIDGDSRLYVNTDSEDIGNSRMVDDDEDFYEQEFEPSSSPMATTKRGRTLLRFGKRGTLLRFGKRGAGSLLRFGKRGAGSLLRFGKRDGSLLRFGKRNGSLLRFGKRNGGLLRFGKRNGSLLRFGKRGDGSLLRFGRRSLSGGENNGISRDEQISSLSALDSDRDIDNINKRNTLLRFGKRGSEVSTDQEKISHILEELFGNSYDSRDSNTYSVSGDIDSKRDLNSFHWGDAEK